MVLGKRVEFLVERVDALLVREVCALPGPLFALGRSAVARQSTQLGIRIRTHPLTLGLLKPPLRISHAAASGRRGSGRLVLALPRVVVTFTFTVALALLVLGPRAGAHSHGALLGNLDVGLAACTVVGRV